MALDLLTLAGAKKLLASPPSWVVVEEMLNLVAPLEVDDAIVEGFQLRGRAYRFYPDQNVTFQLEYFPPGNPEYPGGPLCRLDWRPSNPHNNKNVGPKEFRNILQTGTHIHPFDLNWAHSPDLVKQAILPIAVPVATEPPGVRELFGLVGDLFNIARIQMIEAIPWESRLL